jgi:hypothetical protein
MATNPGLTPPPNTDPTYHPVAAFLSYLVPGLGQISQGRIGKGLLFFVCIYVMFFYGSYLGAGEVTIDGKVYRVTSNVYLSESAEDRGQATGRHMRLLKNLWIRPQFAGQFWVGIAAWPAILQYATMDRQKINDAESEIFSLRQEIEQKKANEPDAIPQLQAKIDVLVRQSGHPWVGHMQREPDEAALNALNNFGDKRLELAWVYTVIAGVLNIMIIYDALCGPAFGSGHEEPEE